MALTVGSRIAHYDVTALIGEGGMGQVYQATDTKLNRQVALKILPEAFASDSDRLARFQREAQVLASLNHTNIGQIHGIEEADGTRALVLELVAGPTLADRIAQGPIPIDEALPIARQIAEGLEAAHEAGVIHRDLKPANIKVREDGTVKVLDFGLAKALDTAPQGDPDQSPTLTAAATQMGVIMGTAAYMSPEQARGKPVDKRADIWAFGAVLYEMLSGLPAFQREDVSLTLASVMKSDLNVTALPPDVSATVRTVVRRCLEKEPGQRIRDFGDVQLALAGAFETVIEQNTSRAPDDADTRSLWERLLPGVGGVIVGGALAVAVPLSLAEFGIETWPATIGQGASSDDHLRRLSIYPQITLSGLGAPVLSPDGRRVAFVGATRSGGSLWVRALDSFVDVRVPGTEGAQMPFWSPGGRWIGFFASGALKKVDLRGSPPVLLASTAGNPRGGTWSRHGDVLFTGSDTPGPLAGISRISEDGGHVTLVTTVSTVSRC